MSSAALLRSRWLALLLVTGTFVPIYPPGTGNSFGMTIPGPRSSTICGKAALTTTLRADLDRCGTGQLLDCSVLP